MKHFGVFGVFFCISCGEGQEAQAVDAKSEALQSEVKTCSLNLDEAMTEYDGSRQTGQVGTMYGAVGDMYQALECTISGNDNAIASINSRMEGSMEAHKTLRAIHEGVCATFLGANKDFSEAMQSAGVTLAADHAFCVGAQEVGLANLILKYAEGATDTVAFEHVVGSTFGGCYQSFAGSIEALGESPDEAQQRGAYVEMLDCMTNKLANDVATLLSVDPTTTTETANAVSLALMDTCEELVEAGGGTDFDIMECAFIGTANTYAPLVTILAGW